MAQIEELLAHDAARVAKIEELVALDAARVAKIEELVALDAARVAKIEELVTLDAARIAELNDVRARSTMDRPLAFMHIPKTAGTAVINGLRQALPATTCITGFDLSMLGTFECRQMLTLRAGVIIHYDGLPPADGPDLVAGHIAYSTLASGRPSARFVTILREPRSRLLSLWAYLRAQPGAESWLGLGWPPLADFLQRAEIACWTDNIAMRMLLWPHPLIPMGGFIDGWSEACLLAEATNRLKSFDCADLIENPGLRANLCALLARPIIYERMNETQVPPELKAPLGDQLTGEAMRLIEHRTRLDRLLWLALAQERVAGIDAVALADETFRRTITRHAELMAP
jgi:hypothetical protein